MTLSAPPEATPERVTAKEWGIVGLVGFVVSIACCGPLFSTWSNWGRGDWDQHLAYHAVPYFTVVEYGQFPLWNPYACGGMVMHANPQARVLSLFFPLHLVFGFLAGIKLEIVVHLLIGLVGAYALARTVTGSRIGATVAAAVFMLNGMYAQSLLVGMTWVLSVAYVPWAFLGFVNSAQRPLFAWLTGASLSLVFFNGGAYVASIAALGLAVFAAFESWRCRRPAPLVRLVVSGALASVLGAAKLLPSVEFLREFPRQIDDYSGYSLGGLATSLFDRRVAVQWSVTDLGVEGLLHGFSYGADENYMYVGLPAAALFIAGILRKYESKPAWIGVVVTAFWLSLGNRVRPSLWSLLHTLPIYDSMRVAQRFRIAMMLGFSIVCGFGAAGVVGFFRGRWGAASAFAASLVLGGVMYGDLMSANWHLFSDAFLVSPAMSGRRPEPFRQLYGEPGAMLVPALRNIGTLRCYETATVARRAISSEVAGYKGEVFLGGTSGRVDIVEWTPNRLRLDVDADRSGFVVVNQNVYPGWTVRQGNTVTSVACRRDECFEYPSALLGIRVGPGHSVLDLRYRPWSFVTGVLVSLTGLVALLLSLWPRSRVWLARRLELGALVRRFGGS